MMNGSKFRDSYYSASVMCRRDNLTVEKIAGDNWSSISMSVNEQPKTEIVLRSQQHAEQLHFLLGQMLGVNE